VLFRFKNEIMKGISKRKSERDAFMVRSKGMENS